MARVLWGPAGEAVGELVGEPRRLVGQEDEAEALAELRARGAVLDRDRQRQGRR